MKPVKARYEDDLQSARRDLAAAREHLERVISTLPADGLTRARRGGWTVARVLEHVLESEWSYARLTARLARAATVPAAPAGLDADDPRPYLDALSASRMALLRALEDADENSFYRLEKLDHGEYSIMSVLENVVAHDREHGAQVRAIIESGAS